MRGFSNKFMMKERLKLNVSATKSLVLYET